MEFPRQKYGVGCQSLLQEIFPTQGSKLYVSCIGRQILYCWARGSPIFALWREYYMLSGEWQNELARCADRVFPGALVSRAWRLRRGLYAWEPASDTGAGGSMKPVFNISPPVAPQSPNHIHMGLLGWGHLLDNPEGVQLPPYQEGRPETSLGSTPFPPMTPGYLRLSLESSRLQMSINAVTSKNHGLT